ncbi:MAG TPA: FKBP-type peptidyl-prolyl cis-trans isomerase [Candidatus Acidoferrum sp.]|nr:FKBP-type peptidyl-prolyl cis-trans isomerase [Candidatus Acidoferrum sp.]
MQKPLIATFVAIAASSLPAASSLAQQSPAGAPQTSPSSAQSSPSKPAHKTPGSKSATPAASAKKAPAPLILKTDKDKASYAVGLNIGKSMHRDAVDIDPAILLRGLKDGLNDSKPLLTDEEARTAIVALQNEIRKTQQVKLQALAENNKKAGDAFLAGNKAKEGVVLLPSGLQYKVLQEGTGPKPVASDTVVCNYRGTLIDNTEFDSSAKHGGQPATFPVTGVIKGWTEALQLMSVGSKWQLFVPSDLAYGPRGAGNVIGPNATLIFEVELLSIKPKPETNQPSAPPAASPAAKPATNPNPPPSAAAPKPNPAPPPTPTPTPTASPTPTGHR